MCTVFMLIFLTSIINFVKFFNYIINKKIRIEIIIQNIKYKFYIFNVVKMMRQI